VISGSEGGGGGGGGKVISGSEGGGGEKVVIRDIGSVAIMINRAATTNSFIFLQRRVRE
jgi:hypothetical protein